MSAASEKVPKVGAIQAIRLANATDNCGGSCVFSGFLNYTPKISDGQAFADNTESAWLSENPVCFHPPFPILARDKGGQAAPVRYDGLAIRPTATQRIGTARSDAL